jgi:hypothetical protein
MNNMELSIAGLIFKEKIDDAEIEILLSNRLRFSNEVRVEDALSSSRNEDSIDILRTEAGTLLLFSLGKIYDLAAIDKDAIQFMNSEVSDIYYFENYVDGEFLRRYIVFQGELAEDVGEESIAKGDNFMDNVWKYIDEYLQINFVENRDSLMFKRYEIK